MKNLMKILSIITMVGLVTMISCKDDDPSPLELSAVTANDIDLNGATAPNTVPSDAVIKVTFSTNVDATSATAANITLTRNFDNVVVPTTISTTDNVVTITPTTKLYSGALYILSLNAGLVSTEGVVFTPITRSFSTAGTFAPAGAVAYFNFESNANDQAGSNNPAASDVIDITYVDGRNSASGKAASFNGTTSIIEVPNAPTLATTADFTLSVWIKPDSAAHHGGNFVIGAGGYNGFEFEINKNDGKMAAQYATGATTSASQDLWLDGKGNTGFSGWTFSKDLTGSGGFAAIVQQKWSHFVFTYEASTKIGTIYLNGEKVKTQDFDLYSAPLNAATGLKFNAVTGVGQKMALGFYSDRSTTAYDWATYTNKDANHFKGLMDDVHIYHQVIPASMITLMYNSGK